MDSTAFSLIFFIIVPRVLTSSGRFSDQTVCTAPFASVQSRQGSWKRASHCGFNLDRYNLRARWPSVSVYNILIEKLEAVVKRGNLLGHNGGLSLNFSDFQRQKIWRVLRAYVHYNARTIRMLRALWSYKELSLTNHSACLTLAIL